MENPVESSKVGLHSASSQMFTFKSKVRIDMRNGCVLISTMATITLKNVSEHLHASLKNLAETHGWSLNKEVLVRLEASLHAGSLDVEATAASARQMRERMGVYLTQRDVDRFKSDGRA